MAEENEGPRGNAVPIESSEPSALLSPSLITCGSARAVDAGPLVAGARHTLEVEVVAAEPVPAGHSIELWKHFVSDMEELQCASPDAPGYFSAERADGAALEAYVHPHGVVHGPGTFFPYRRYGGARLREALDGEGAVRFHLQDVGVQTYADRPFNLRAALLDGDDLLGYFGDALFHVRGGPASYLNVVAPTVVAVGEPFDCRVIVCDEFRNPSSDITRPEGLEIGPDHLEYDGFEVDQAASAITLRNVRIDREGVTYIHVSAGSPSEVAGTSNPVVVRRAPVERIYWGDIHQHTYMADGRSRPRESYEYGRRVALLDFGSVTPHVMSTFQPPLVRMDAPVQDGWPEVREATREADGDDFVAFLGYETGVRQLVGDMNAYFLKFDVEPVEKRLGRRPESYPEFVRALEDTPSEVLLLPHAHAGGGPGKFDLPELPELQPNVEICSVHGVFPEFYHQWLRAGHRVGVHGAGDNHMPAMGNAFPGLHYVNTNGLTAAVCAGKTREEIWRAFKERKTYAVTGNRRIFLQFSIDDHPMGSVVPAGEGPRRVRVQVAGTSPILRVELLRNCEVVRTYRPPEPDRDLLRVMWMDTWPERRADDSRTVGTVEYQGGKIALLEGLGAWNRDEEFREEADGVRFCAHAYSESPRGVLLRVEEGTIDAVLTFAVRDVRWGVEVLNESLRLPLRERRARAATRLDVDPSRLREEFSRQIVIPEFTVEAEWVDFDWSPTARVEWEDERSAQEDCYYVRVEQLDGMCAWSSPIWFVSDG